MATKVYDTVSLELQSGRTIDVKPVSLKVLRKVMAIMTEMQKAQAETVKKMEAALAADEEYEELSELDTLDFLVRAAQVCLTDIAPDLASDSSKVEDELDIQTMWKVLEVGGGVSPGNPNLNPGVELPGTI